MKKWLVAVLFAVGAFASLSAAFADEVDVLLDRMRAVILNPGNVELVAPTQEAQSQSIYTHTYNDKYGATLDFPGVVRVQRLRKKCMDSGGTDLDAKEKCICPETTHKLNVTRNQCELLPPPKVEEPPVKVEEAEVKEEVVSKDVVIKKQSPNAPLGENSLLGAVYKGDNNANARGKIFKWSYVEGGEIINEGKYPNEGETLSELAGKPSSSFYNIKQKDIGKKIIVEVFEEGGTNPVARSEPFDIGPSPKAGVAFSGEINIYRENSAVPQIARDSGVGRKILLDQDQNAINPVNVKDRLFVEIPKPGPVGCDNKNLRYSWAVGGGKPSAPNKNREYMIKREDSGAEVIKAIITCTTGPDANPREASVKITFGKSAENNTNFYIYRNNDPETKIKQAAVGNDLKLKITREAPGCNDKQFWGVGEKPDWPKTQAYRVQEKDAGSTLIFKICSGVEKMPVHVENIEIYGVKISGGNKLGDTLTANVSHIGNENRHFIWVRSGENGNENINQSNFYTHKIGIKDTGKDIRVFVWRGDPPSASDLNSGLDGFLAVSDPFPVRTPTCSEAFGMSADKKIMFVLKDDRGARKYSHSCGDNVHWTQEEEARVEMRDAATGCEYEKGSTLGDWASGCFYKLVDM